MRTATIGSLSHVMVVAIAAMAGAGADARSTLETCGPGNPNDCFRPSISGPPGCSDEECCELVCGSDPFCCRVVWDDICAGEAIALCLGCPAPACEGATLEREPFGVQLNPACLEPGFAPTPIACGQSVCGSLWHVANPASEDRDAYLFTIEGHPRRVTVTAQSDNVVLISLYRAEDCSAPFEPVTEEIDGCVRTVSACLLPGEYVFQLRASWNGPGDDDQPYRVDFTCAEPPCEPAGCGSPSSGTCFDEHAGAYCEDPTCCEVVCELDDFCCSSSWDRSCAADAWCFCAIGGPPSNDDCADAMPIGEGIHEARTCGASTDGPPTNACGDVGYGNVFRDVWFRYTPSASGLATIATCGSNFGEVVAVYEGCVCGDSAEAIGCAYRPCPPEEILCLPVRGSQCYLIRIGGLTDHEAGDAVLSITLDAACDSAPVCPNPTHDCYSHGTVGCSDELCCAAVCASNTYCCDVAWDCRCIEDAKVLCGGQPCAPLVAPEGAIIEPEPCGANLNGGCVPPATTPLATPIACGDVVFGSAWASDISTDRDHFVFTIASAGRVRFTVQAEFYGSISIGPYGCSNVNLGFERVGGCQERTAFACLQPGTYLARVVRITTQSPCGSEAGNDYIARLDCDASCLAPPPNDDCADALPLGRGVTTFTNELATTDGPMLAPACSENVTEKELFNDVWFEYESDQEGVLNVELRNATIEARVFVYEKADCADLPLHILACSDESCVAAVTASTPIACGARYLVRVGGTNALCGGTGELTISTNGRRCGLVGDLDGDGIVGPADLAILLGEWGGSGIADIDGDGVVGAGDLAILLGAWHPG